MTAGWDGSAQVMFFKDGAPYEPCAKVEYFFVKPEVPGAELMNSYLITARTTKQQVSAIIDCENKQVSGVMLMIPQTSKSKSFSKSKLPMPKIITPKTNKE